MTDIHDLTKESLPCWSKLVWTPSPPMIGIWIYEDAVHQIDSLTSEHYRVQRFPQPKSFTNTTHEWGFDGCLKRSQDPKNGFHGFFAEIPCVQIQEGVCDACDEQGETEYGASCILCDGTHQRYQYDWSITRPISESLALLTTTLHYSGIQNPLGDISSVQLISPMLLTLEEERNYGIHGIFSPRFTDWLRASKDRKFKNAIEAMRIVNQRIFGAPDDPTDYRFIAECRSSGWLNIGCPGDRCGIHPADLCVPPTGGYAFSCHNVDNHHQQLMLLAALAAIEETAREELNA